MGEYISSFGVTRTVGRGEGRDELYDASAKPALGAHNVIEVVVDEKGPVANKVNGHYGKDAACLPAGATLVGGHLIKDEGSASVDGVSLSLVKEDGTDPVTILASASGEVSALTGLNTKFSEKRFVKATGNGAGMKAKVVIEYI